MGYLSEDCITLFHFVISGDYNERKEAWYERQSEKTKITYRFSVKYTKGIVYDEFREHSMQNEFPRWLLFLVPDFHCSCVNWKSSIASGYQIRDKVAIIKSPYLLLLSSWRVLSINAAPLKSCEIYAAGRVRNR